MKPNDTNDSRYRAAYLGCVLSAGMSARPRPHVVAALVLDMQRAARAAVGYETRRCSYPMTEAQELRGERRIQRLQDGINARLAAVWPGEASPSLSLGGDPRGPCATLTVPGQEGDGWAGGGGGFAVY